MEKLIKYTCLLCGRNKFTKPSPHICNGQFRKRKIKWIYTQRVDSRP